MSRWLIVTLGLVAAVLAWFLIFADAALGLAPARTLDSDRSPPVEGLGFTNIPSDDLRRDMPDAAPVSNSEVLNAESSADLYRVLSEDMHLLAGATVIPVELEWDGLRQKISRLGDLQSTDAIGEFVLRSSDWTTHLLIEKSDLLSCFFALPLKSKDLVLRRPATVEVFMAAPADSAVTLHCRPNADALRPYDAGSWLLPNADGFFVLRREEVEFKKWSGSGLVDCLIPGAEYEMLAEVHAKAGILAASERSFVAPTSLRLVIPDFATIRFIFEPCPSAGVAYVLGLRRAGQKLDVDASGLASMTSIGMGPGEWQVFAYGDGWSLEKAFEFVIPDPMTDAEYRLATVASRGVEILLPEGLEGKDVKLLTELENSSYIVLGPFPREDRELRAAKLGDKIDVHGVSAPTRVLLEVRKWLCAIPYLLSPGAEPIAVTKPTVRRGTFRDGVIEELRRGSQPRSIVILQQRVSWPDGFEYWHSTNSWMPFRAEREISMVDGFSYRLGVSASGEFTFICNVTAADLVAR